MNREGALSQPMGSGQDPAEDTIFLGWSFCVTASAHAFGSGSGCVLSGACAQPRPEAFFEEPEPLHAAFAQGPRERGAPAWIDRAFGELFDQARSHCKARGMALIAKSERCLFDAMGRISHAAHWELIPAQEKRAAAWSQAPELASEAVQQAALRLAHLGLAQICGLGQACAPMDDKSPHASEAAEAFAHSAHGDLRARTERTTLDRATRSARPKISGLRI